MRLTSNQILLLRRKKGERNLSTTALANEIGITRKTIGKIVNGKAVNVQNKTVRKVNDWLIKQSL